MSACESNENHTFLYFDQRVQKKKVNVMCFMIEFDFIFKKSNL